MTFSRSKSLLLVLSLISVILITVFVLGVYSIRAKNEKISGLLNLADQVAEAKTLSQSIKAAQHTASEEIKAYNDLILSEYKLVPLIEDIEDSGRALGLDIDILSVGEVKDSGTSGPQKIRMAIETRGSWARSFSFVYVIESLPHRVIVDEIILSKEGDGWHSKIALSFYLFD
jgi:Tfp pilus assembly protein PilO